MRKENITSPGGPAGGSSARAPRGLGRGPPARGAPQPPARRLGGPSAAHAGRGRCLGGDLPRGVLDGRLPGRGRGGPSWDGGRGGLLGDFIKSHSANLILEIPGNYPESGRITGNHRKSPDISAHIKSMLIHFWSETFGPPMSVFDLLFFFPLRESRLGTWAAEDALGSEVSVRCLPSSPLPCLPLGCPR